MTDKIQDKVIIIRVTEDLLAQIDGAAEKMGKKLGFIMNRSNLVRSLVVKGIKRMERDE